MQIIQEIKARTAWTPILFRTIEWTQFWFLQRVEAISQLFLAGLAGFLRLWRINIPNGFVFDEVYFPVFAKNYLSGTTFFDTHPPLGKYLIAIGIRFFGFNPLGYSIRDALFGIGVIILIYRLGLMLFKSRRIAFLAGFLACLDGLLLVESRTGLINIFAVFFSLGAYYLFLKSGAANIKKPRWLYLAGAGISVGAAAAVKWIGAASLGVILLIYLMARLKGRIRWLSRFIPKNTVMRRIGKFNPVIVVACCILIPVLVYSATFVIHLKQNPEYTFIELHRQIFGYHAHLKDSHGYASDWWSWPLSLRPVNYYWRVDEKTQLVQAIVNIGNPLLFWFAIPAVLFALREALLRRNFGAQFALLALTQHYLPFAFISRATFSYHFMGALPFTIMLLAYALNRLWSGKSWQKELAFLAILSMALTAIYFYPIWTAFPIPRGAFYQRMWLSSWI